MTEFEFLFALYALVMGLSLVELLSGLGRALEYRLTDDNDARQFKFGWLTPLLAIFVIIDSLSFWMFAWPIRELLTVSAFSIVGVVAFSGAYFLAARLVFPSEPENFRDLDTHFFRVRRVVFAMLIVMVFIQWAFILVTPELQPLAMQPMAVGMTLVLLALMGAAITVGNARWVTGILLVLIARYLVVYLI